MPIFGEILEKFAIFFEKCQIFSDVFFDVNFFSELRFFLGYSFDVKFRARSIGEVFRVIPTLLPTKRRLGLGYRVG